jgi:NAD+ kinase
MRIFLLGNGSRSGVPETAEAIRPLLREHCEIVVDDLTQKVDLSPYSADLTLVLGGDGAILRACRQMGCRQLPVLGVNLGRLGFLADLTQDEVCCVFPEVVKGQFRVTKHVMFECIVEGPEGECYRSLGLNEIAIQTGPPFHMIDLELSVDGEVISGYSGDGLILSTPIGSTGHSLSAGGPILGQEIEAFVITPICPHSLTSRPVVESASREYNIVVRRGASGTLLVVDGQDLVPLTPEYRVTFRRARVDFQLVKVSGHSYYRTLRDKLSWGTPPNYRSEPGRPPQRSNEEKAAEGAKTE